MENLPPSPFLCATRKTRRTPLLVCLLFTVSVCAALVPLAAQAGAHVGTTRRPSRAFTSSAASRRTRPDARRRVRRRAAERSNKSRTQSPPAPRRASSPGASEFEEDSKGRASWFLFKRAYPFDSVPAESRRRAWESRPRKSKGASALGSDARQAWAAIGPKPTATTSRWGVSSGRINAVAVSPADARVVLVGSSTGGIWRSTDGGANFVPVSDDQSDLAVGSLAFAPSNPSIVYAGMGDMDFSYLGSGVLKSTDGGRTWVRVSNQTLPDGVVSRLEVDPNNAARVYVAQYLTKDLSNDTSLAGGLFLSTDGGVNWTKTLAGQARDIVIHPTNPQTLYATLAERLTSGSATNPAGLYRSIDGGTTWANIPVPTSGLHAGLWDFRVAVTPADPERLYAYYGSIFFGETRLQVSTDGGSTWQARSLASVDSGQFGYNTYLHVDPTNPDTIYLGSRDLYKSTDGGGSWSNMTNNFARSGDTWKYQPSLSSTHADQQAFAFEPGHPSVVYVANDGGLWKSSDGGATLQSLNSTLSLIKFNSLALHPTDAGFSIGGTQDNGTQRRLRDSSTGAATDTWGEFSGSDGGACFIDPVRPDILFGTFFSA